MRHIGNGKTNSSLRNERSVRFAGEIEQVLRRWLWTPEGSLSNEVRTVELKQKLHFRKESYVLSLHLPGSQTQDLPVVFEDALPSGLSTESAETFYSYSESEGEDFEFLPPLETESATEKKQARSNPIFAKTLFVPSQDQFADEGTSLQRRFGVSRFVLLRTGNPNGRILDVQEASTLLSAAAVALSEFPKPLPIFLPIQNVFRDAYRGVAIVEERTVFFETDSSHLTQQPEHLRSVIGQLQVFAKQLYRYAPKGARLCDDIACGIETQIDQYEIGVSSCVTYKLPLPGRNEDPEEAQSWWNENWDGGCVWEPWASEKDPVASLELDLVWSDVELTSENPMPILSATKAMSWRVHPLAEDRHLFESWAIFSKKDSFNRRHLRFREDHDVDFVRDYDGENFRSLSARLSALLQAVHLTESARSVSELASEE